jgi:hypothetical protein
MTQAPVSAAKEAEAVRPVPDAYVDAAVDLARLAGLSPAGVICEIVNDDGTMARLLDLIRFCKTHGLLMVTVADLARYRLDAEMDTSFGAIEGFCGACS